MILIWSGSEVPYSFSPFGDFNPTTVATIKRGCCWLMKCTNGFHCEIDFDVDKTTPFTQRPSIDWISLCRVLWFWLLFAENASEPYNWPLRISNRAGEIRSELNLTKSTVWPKTHCQHSSFIYSEAKNQKKKKKLDTFNDELKKNTVSGSRLRTLNEKQFRKPKFN